MTPKPCGTRAAYVRHRRNGETPCDECRAANRQLSAADRRAQGIPERPEPVCGSYAGWFRHRRNNEPPCDPCENAARTYWRRSWRRRNGRPRPTGEGRIRCAGCGRPLVDHQLTDPPCVPVRSDVGDQRHRRTG